MSKKIGFRSYQNDEEPDKQDELEKQQAERQKAIANFIGQNYSPIGTTSQKCYKTTAELVYELSNIVDVAPMALAKQLADGGRKINCVMRRFFQAHRSGIGQRQGGAPALPTSVKLQQFKPISKLYR